MSDINYKSIFGATRQITPAAYIAELIVARQAKWSKVVLPDRFWNDNDFILWTGKWKFQMRQANSLINSGFDPAVIISVLNKTNNIGTLTNKRLYPLLVEEQRKKDNNAKIEHTQIETTSTTEKPQAQFGKKSKRSKLD
jgi:hypothetical protein